MFKVNIKTPESASWDNSGNIKIAGIDFLCPFFELKFLIRENYSHSCTRMFSYHKGIKFRDWKKKTFSGYFILQIGDCKTFHGYLISRFQQK